MRKCETRTVEAAFVYVADCNLATVCDMAMKKSRPKHEFDRQVAIAQFMVDKIREFAISASGTRVAGVEGAGSVLGYARQFMPEHKDEAR